MQSRMIKKGGPWVLTAWLFILIIITFLCFIYYDYEKSDGTYSENETVSENIKLYDPPPDKPFSPGAPFIVSNGVTILMPDIGNVAVEYNNEKDMTPLLTVDVFPQKK